MAGVKKEFNLVAISLGAPWSYKFRLGDIAWLGCEVGKNSTTQRVARGAICGGDKHLPRGNEMMTAADQQRATITALAQEIKTAGFRPFIAKGGTYGFYTDAAGSRVVSFSLDFGAPIFSGNHVSEAPKSHGQGWRMESRASYADMLSALTPQWAGGSNCRPKTLKEYQDDYQSSSQFTELSGEG